MIGREKGHELSPNHDPLPGIDSYARWSRICFLNRVQPLLNRLPTSDKFSEIWLQTCAPGDDPSVRSRLFPGSLFILWTEAIGGPGASRGAEPIAAALECLHNASLLHDDILDDHKFRRRQETILGTHGLPHALLGHDGLTAYAMTLLSQTDKDRLPGCLARIGRALQGLSTGQLLDEPTSWQAVDHERREEHWHQVCRGKLSIGNVTGPLAAFWTERTDVETSVNELVSDHSIVSQIINDFGDLFGWTGYHQLAPAMRYLGQEANLKPTLPHIWFEQNRMTDIRSTLELASVEIERRQSLALERLDNLDLWQPGRRLLEDFIGRPSLPSGGESS